MMSASAVRQRAEEAGKYAKKAGYVPLLITSTMRAEAIRVWDEGGRPSLNVPFIGDYVPKGFAPTDVLFFVDSTGMGEVDEAALTVAAFLRRLTPGRAYAIVEAGEFQVYVQEFVMEGATPKGVQKIIEDLLKVIGRQ